MRLFSSQEPVVAITGASAKACCAPADVAQADAVFRAADAIEEALGPLEVWINDAMVTMFAPVAEITPEEFRRVTEVTYLGFVHGTMAALRHMRPRNRGTIVQVGSALAYRGIPLQSAYCGAKHAMQGFTQSIRTELMTLVGCAWHTFRRRCALGLVFAAHSAGRLHQAAVDRLS